MVSKEKKETFRFSPWDNAGSMSKFFACFMWPIISQFERGQLNLENQLATSKSFKANKLRQSLEINYYKHNEPDGAKPKSRLRVALLQTFGPDLAKSGLALLINLCLCQPLQIIALGWLIRDTSIYLESQLQSSTPSSLNGTASSNSNETLATITPNEPSINFASDIGSSIMLDTLVVIISSWTVALFNIPHFMIGFNTGLKSRIALTSLVFKKSLKLNLASLNVATTGRLTNMLSGDMNNFDLLSRIGPYLFVAPLQVFITVMLLYKFYIGGLPTLAVLTVLLIYTILNIMSSTLFSICRRIQARRTDERIRIVNELIDGIRIIKMYAWEAPMKLVLAAARRREINMIATTSLICVVFYAIYMITDMIVIFSALITYIFYLGQTIDPATVFVTMGLCTQLKNPFMFHFTTAARQLAETSISCDRITEFLNLPEDNKTNPSKVDLIGANGKETILNRTRNHRSRDGRYVLNFDKVSASWVEDCPIINDLSFSLGHELLLVIGRVGAGRSSLLMTILGELEVSSGRVDVNGKLSYCPQEAWIFPGTVRENILLEHPYIPERYEAVLKACSLTKDLAILPFGDGTLVGERGVSLSGGQKARVNLARSLYHEADIYLLDDPLSAVDAPVARDIFKNAIKKFLKGKCVILATHQLQFLQKAAKILILDKERGARFGGFDEILASGALNELVREDDPGFEQEIALTSTEMKLEAETGEADTKKPKIASILDHRQAGVEKSIANTSQWNCFKYYLNNASNPLSIIIFAIITITSQFLITYMGLFLSFWSDTIQRRSIEGAEFKANSFYDYMDQHQLMFTFLGLIGLSFVALFIRTLFFYGRGLVAARKIHDRFFHSVINAPVKFFDFNPSGLLLNRFSRDIGFIDQQLNMTMFEVYVALVTTTGVILLSVYVNPWNLIAGILFFILINAIRAKVMNIMIKLKLLEGLQGNHVVTHLNVSVKGLTSIRAFGIEQQFLDTCDGLLDSVSSVSFMYCASTRFMSIVIDLISLLLITTVVIVTVASLHSTSPSAIGLLISQMIAIPTSISWCVYLFVEAASQMTSLQRVKDYSDIEPEEPVSERAFQLESKADKVDHVIRYIDVSLRYFEDEAFVLQNLNVNIKAGEKIGIVGRTGAGKSSIISTLFRLYDFEGRIEIHGSDTKLMNLQELRSSMSIIPQDPVLFAGSLRKNLDPFSKCTDTELWSALEAVQLKSYISNTELKLDHHIQESGSNFSVGQRQLICLARAVVRRNDILIMDEATANVDQQTDAFIQQTIRTQFSNCTVITIAHRLLTVANSDRVLVLDRGQVKEFDDPHLLIQNKSSSLRQMIDQSGKQQAKRIIDAIIQSRRC